MDTKQIFEVNSIAQTANNAATKALSAIDTHEKICAERYTHIKEAMGTMALAISTMQNNLSSSQSTMQISINNLSATKSEMLGGMKVIKFSAVILTIVALLTAFHTAIQEYVEPAKISMAAQR